jgi:hypothetical protein
LIGILVSEWVPMQFRFCPQLEQSCPHVGHCPHLGGAALGTLVTWANTSGDTIDHLHKALDAERERNAKLVEENLRLEKAWEQAKLELKLERQNKFATCQQKQIESFGIRYRKVPQSIQEMFGITFTPAALIGFETMLADLAEPVVDDIAQKLASSEGPVHADETYWTPDGARSYFRVHGDEKYIYSWTTRAFHRQITWRSEP